MTYLRLSLRGTIGTSEVWSVNPAFNLSYEKPEPYEQSEMNTAAENVGNVTVPNTLKALMSTAGPGAIVRLEQRTDAHELQAVGEAVWNAGSAGTGSATKPPQTSVVFSLRSNVPGTRGRGRIYWPGLGATVSASTLRLSSPSPDQLADDMATYLKNVQLSLQSALEPFPSLGSIHLCVVSPTTATRTDINRIEVGDVLDVQRRRRDKLAETYVSSVFPPV